MGSREREKRETGTGEEEGEERRGEA